MKHIPVLKNEIDNCFKYLKETSDVFFVDGTIGLAGHSTALANQFKINDLNFKFLGIDKEEEFLNISKNRKLEIENKITAANYRNKISGFNNKKELELFLFNEPKAEYLSELNF